MDEIEGLSGAFLTGAWSASPVQVRVPRRFRPMGRGEEEREVCEDSWHVGEIMRDPT